MSQHEEGEKQGLVEVDVHAPSNGTTTERRMRALTEKGLEYQVDLKLKRRREAYKKLKAKGDHILSVTAVEKVSTREVQSLYSEWGTLYEVLLDLNEEYNELRESISDDEWFLKIAEEITAVRTQIEVWFSENPTSHASSGSSSASAHSSMRSKAVSLNESERSSVKFREKQRQSELKIKAAALEERRKLEEQKLKLKLQEEELKIKEQLAISEAKLDQIEELSEVASQASRHASFKIGSHKSDTQRKLLRSSPKRSVFQQQQSEEEAVKSMVTELRKPTSDIQKFSSDPLQFQRFIRQFKHKIENVCIDPEERLNYLEQYTCGEARDVVKSFTFVNPDYGYDSAIEELARRYGDEDIIVAAFIEKALNWKPIKSDDPKELDKFSIFLNECLNAVTNLGAIEVLEYSDNVRKIVAKLPVNLYDKWRTKVFQIKESSRRVKFHDLVKFVEYEAKKANDPVFGRCTLTPGPKGHKKSTFATSVRTNDSNKALNKQTTVQPAVAATIPQQIGKIAHTAQNQGGKAFISPCLYCHGMHPLELCTTLQGLQWDDRLTILKPHGLCFGCLRVGHRSKDCKHRMKCSVCGKQHPFVMHRDSPHSPVSQTADNCMKPNTTSANVVVSGTDSHRQTEETDVTMAVIPVKVRYKDRSTVVETYAFLDPDSNASFLTTELMDQLGCEGSSRRLTMDTMGTTHTMMTKVVKGLQLSGLDTQSIVELPVMYSKDDIPVKRKHIPTTEDIHKWPHLQDIMLPVVDANIGLVPGNNVPDAYSPLELRTGPPGTPHMTKSRLGWIPWNIMRNAKPSDVSVNRVDVLAVEKLEEDKNLEILYRRSLSLDFSERYADDKQEFSQEDHKFLEIMESSKSFKDGHYVFDLPFKQSPVFPDNRSMALSRLESLKKKLLSKSELLQEYTEFMDALEERGYAERVPEDKLDRPDGKQWYVPHHAVFHPQKKKLRVVFDCSARYQGISLNDALLQGPDLTNNLIGVLMRFRQEDVAIAGDIEKMFYQVGVTSDDRDCLRYYWWPGGDLQQEPVSYRMTVHLFGAVSSPSCANFALRSMISNNRDRYDEEICTVSLKDFYVDDFLHSVRDEETATAVIEKVTDLCRNGGFRVTKWTSNRPEALRKLDESERAAQDDEWARALGMLWNLATDEFHFSIQIDELLEVTRRSILSEVSGTFDPLGLIAPFILPAKLLLQQLCQENYDWDQEVDDAYRAKWFQWTESVKYNVSIPRCVKPSFGRVEHIQLHMFSDASESGYGVAGYLRFTNKEEQICCALIMGKSRVAPLKKITIPRMELTAATLAVKLSHQIERMLGNTFSQIVFWTDSMTVIRYIRNTSTRYQTFVANRLSIIHDGSIPDQWRYVRSEDNPADYASRGIRMTDTEKTDIWFGGPPFLQLHGTEWPKDSDADPATNDNDPEVKKQSCGAVTSEADLNTIDLVISRSSTWTKAKRVLGWILFASHRFKEMTKQSNRSTSVAKKGVTSTSHIKTVLLPVDYLRSAEVMILKHTQEQCFLEEMEDLHRGDQVKKSSTLSRLDPYIDGDLIRVGGRLDRADIPFESKHQILLPRKSRVLLLLMEDRHKSVGHLGKATMLSKLRERFWIVGAGHLAKSITTKCVVCRKYQAKRCEQKMADLPEYRVTPDEPPFTRVGLDFFGPFEVTRGRTSVKRYALIFTCLSIRAVHLEMAFSLDTTSCINAIRRFIARRGPVKLFVSDNGTNFQAAHKEFQKEIENVDFDKVQEAHQIEWQFNPPSGSHFGGVWERLIRNARKVMYSLRKENTFRLDDEGLQTLLCEVEAILNGRPITQVSEDHDDPEPLTPNHLLLLRSGEKRCSDNFDPLDAYARRRWRHIQYLANTFWKRLL